MQIPILNDCRPIPFRLKKPCYSFNIESPRVGEDLGLDNNKTFFCADSSFKPTETFFFLFLQVKTSLLVLYFVFLLALQNSFLSVFVPINISDQIQHFVNFLLISVHLRNRMVLKYSFKKQAYPSSIFSFLKNSLTSFVQLT